MKNIANYFFSLLVGGMLMPAVAMGQNLTINTNLSALTAGGTVDIPYVVTNADGYSIAVTPVGDLTAKVKPADSMNGVIEVTSTGLSVEGAKILVSLVNGDSSMTWSVDKTEVTGAETSEGGPVISIDGVDLVDGPMATATDQLENQGGSVALNPYMIAGGTNQVTITSPEELQTIQLAEANGEGHFELNAADYLVQQPESGLRSSSYVYQVNLNASLQMTVNVNIQIIVITIGGDCWGHSEEITYQPANTGDLKVSLTFYNEKDVDLWVKEPNGNFVYFGNRKPFLAAEDSRVIGLDLDSNPGCHIDGVNNENIYFDEACLQKGTYEVYVLMYSNCNPAIATDYTVNAYYKGELLETTGGSNPAQGTFAVNYPSEGTNRGTPVMTFTIDEGHVVPEYRSVNIPIEKNLTESAKMKLRQVGLID